MKVSKSGYYAWVKAGCPKPHNKDSVLLAHIRQIERENDNNYGVQKVYEELKAKGVLVGRSRVQLVMHLMESRRRSKTSTSLRQPRLLPMKKRTTIC